MPIDVTVLWSAEANWAAREWTAEFEPQRRHFMSVPGAMGNSRTWLLIGEAAKRTFETVSDKLLQRVRKLLAERDQADHIGTPGTSPHAIAGALIQAALDGVPNGEKVAGARGFSNSSMLTGPLNKTRAELEAMCNAFRQALANEITIRLDQIEAAKKASERRLENAVLGDFVALAKSAIAEGNKDVAAVLAAAALEDCLKRFAIRHGVDVERKKMQDIVGALKAKGLVIGSSKDMLDTMPKLRDYAMHALWNKFDAATVNAMIGYVEQFLAQHFT